MFFKFKNKKITGMLTVVPNKATKFVDEVNQYNFPPARSLKLKDVMGYDEHRVADDDVTASDMAIFGAKHLIDKGLLNIDDIDGLIFVSHTPDYIMPPTSSVIQGKLGLKKDMLCLDINQGCAGFVLGLLQAFMMLNSGSIKKVVLINADTLSRKVSKKDRNSYPLVGDAASISIIENDDSGGDIFASLYMDGSEYNALIIPAGGMRLPSSSETSKMVVADDGNERSLDHLVMKGVGVFNFVQVVVPSEISKTLEYANVTDKDIFAYCFHQPNKFMLEKLADKLEVDRAKVPSNIVEKFGNSNSVTIPMVITHNFSEILMNGYKKVCFSGFGVGLTCASMVMDIGNFKFCEMIEYASK